MAHESYETFEAVKERLDEIVDAVGSSDLPLDDALALYEEAVGLGLRASNLLETDIEAHSNDAEAEREASEERAPESDKPFESGDIPESNQPVFDEHHVEEKAEV